METHAHRLAKGLLVDWLRAAAQRAGYDEYAEFAGLSWRVNRPGPAWGIWAEYPILSDKTGLDQVWDERAARWSDSPPSYQQVVDMGSRPNCVLDIAIQHKGRIAFAIEICHKHHCGPRKLKFLRDELQVIEIPTQWVLGQVDRPAQIPVEFYL